MIDSKNNFEIFSNVTDKKSKKCTKWIKFKYYVNKKKCFSIADIKDKRVYFDTLSLSSVKRSLNRICKHIFKSGTGGYEKIISDDEKRFYLNTDRSLVEGVY